MEEHCGFFPLALNTEGVGAAEGLTVVRDLFEALGLLEENTAFSLTGLFNHPDGAFVRVKAHLVLDPRRGMLLELLRRSGDCDFFVLIYRYVKRALAAMRMGIAQQELPLICGELVPRLKPAAEPHVDLPELFLDPFDIYAQWDHDDFEDFMLKHSEVTSQERKGSVSVKAFREHVKLIPESILRAKLLPKSLAPSMGACERLAQVAAEGEAYFASRS